MGIANRKPFTKVDKPFWDLDESENFIKITSKVDSLIYKVYNVGTDSQKQAVADALGISRMCINKILFYLIQNSYLWENKKMAWGIIHTFDIHIPCWKKYLGIISTTCLDDIGSFEKLNNLINKHSLDKNDMHKYNMQEMTPNKYGILGLNKPKIIVNDKGFEYCTKRSMHLTLRDINGNNSSDVYPYIKYMKLVIHELTHTTCNDVRWKKDNHMYPYEKYHTFMKDVAKDLGIL